MHVSTDDPSRAQIRSKTIKVQSSRQTSGYDAKTANSGLTDESRFNAKDDGEDSSTLTSSIQQKRSGEQPHTNPGPAQAMGTEMTVMAKLKETAVSLLFQSLDISVLFLRLMKVPFALLLGILSVIAMISQGHSSLNVALTHRVHQLCAMPLVSIIPMCAAAKGGSSIGPRVVSTSHRLKFSDVVDLQLQMNSILRATGVGAGVAMKVKTTSFAVSDLAKRVKRSDLLHKGALMSLLERIESAADISSDMLSQLDADVLSVVNTFVATDNQAIDALERIKQERKPKSIFTDLIYRTVASAPSQSDVIKLYNRSAARIEEKLDELIQTTTKTETDLKRLGGLLGDLGVAVIDDKNHSETAHQKLESLWCKLARHHTDIQRFKANLSLLSQISKYHETATNIVRGTLGELQRLRQGVSRLRKDVTFVDEDDSFEGHLDSLRRGVKTLTAQQDRAKRLEDEVIRQMFEGRDDMRIERA